MFSCFFNAAVFVFCWCVVFSVVYIKCPFAFSVHYKYNSCNEIWNSLSHPDKEKRWLILGKCYGIIKNMSNSLLSSTETE
jgi:hypothetical protein